MKKLFFLLLCFFVLSQSCYAISIADSTRVTKAGFGNSGNEHVHVATKPSKVYSLTVTSISTSGFAQLIETNSNIDSAPPSETGQDYVSKGTVLADVLIAVAANTVQVTFKGLGVGKQLFLDCHGAQAIVEFKE